MHENEKLLLWLSVIAFVQVLLIAFGGAFIMELIAVDQDRSIMLFAAVISAALLTATFLLYMRTFQAVEKDEVRDKKNKKRYE